MPLQVLRTQGGWLLPHPRYGGCNTVASHDASGTLCKDREISLAQSEHGYSAKVPRTLQCLQTGIKQRLHSTQALTARPLTYRRTGNTKTRQTGTAYKALRVFKARKAPCKWPHKFIYSYKGRLHSLFCRSGLPEESNEVMPRLHVHHTRYKKSNFLPFLSPTTIPQGEHRFSSDHRS